MKIKTSELEGTLLYMSNNDHSHSLKVFIRHGFLVAKLIMDDDVETELESVYVVAENEWKEVEVIIIIIIIIINIITLAAG